MLGASFLFMFPVTFYAESKNKFDRAILLGVGFLMSSFTLDHRGYLSAKFLVDCGKLVSYLSF